MLKIFRRKCKKFIENIEQRFNWCEYITDPKIPANQIIIYFTHTYTTHWKVLDCLLMGELKKIRKFHKIRKTISWELRESNSFL